MNESLTKKYRVTMSELRKANDTIIERDISIKLKNNKLDLQQLEIKELKDRWELLQKGATIYTEDMLGYIDSLVIIPNDFKTSYPQETLKELGTKLYRSNPFYKMVNGKVEIDETQLKKYKRSLII